MRHHRKGCLMLRTPQQIIDLAELTPAITVNQDRSEVRMYATFTAGILLFWLIEPIAYITLLDDSIIYAVAQRLTLPGLPLWACCIGAAIMLPHIFCLLFSPKTLVFVLPRMAAAFAAYGSCVIWMYLAWASLPLDYGPVWFPYVVRAMGSFLGAIAIGKSVNVQQIKEALELAKHKRALAWRIEDLKGAART